MRVANWLDRVILAVNPIRGRVRIQNRMRAQHMMNFDAASRGRRTYGFKAPATSADAAIFGQSARLRNISRDFLRNHPLAVRAREVVVANVVGAGIQFSVRHDDKDVRARIEEVLKAHLLTPAIDAHGEYDLHEMQEVILSSVFSDGEVLARRRMRSGAYARGLRLPFQIELLEADFLDSTVQSWGENEVIDGVEYGPTGSIEAYHLYDQHPGAVTTRRKLTSRRVRWQDVIHVRRIERAGQLRGVPWLAPVLMTMGELRDYQESQILKQKMAAMLAGVIEWEDGIQRPSGYESTGLEKLEPGAIADAPEGASVKWTDPPKVEGYPEFMATGIRTMAVGLGLSYEALSGDMSGVNFSSARMGRMEMDRNVARWQKHLMINQFCAGVARWVGEAWPMQAVEAQTRFALEWTPPRRVLIDPNREVEAVIRQIEARLTSRQRAQRELGNDPDTIRQEIAEDITEDAAANLPPLSGSGNSKPGDDEGDTT